MSQICSTLKKEQKFLAKDLPNFGEKPRLDVNKIVVMGTELGGLAAISSAKGSSKIKFVASIDPWTFPYSTMIKAGKLKVDHPTLIISTSSFTKERDSMFNDADLKT